jgi:hypothetical protein
LHSTNYVRIKTPLNLETADENEKTPPSRSLKVEPDYPP